MIKLLIVSATTKDTPEETLLWGSLEKLIKMGDLSYKNVHFVTSNTDGLASVYNRFMTKEYSRYVIVFVHDDAVIEDLYFVEKIQHGVGHAPILGVAGCGTMQVKEPALWHLMAPRANLRGEVAHFFPEDSQAYKLTNGQARMTTVFGPPLGRVVAIDGVCMVVDRTNTPLELKFDEECPSKFHFYDLNFCQNALNMRIPIDIIPLHIVHKSPGLTEFSDDWKRGQGYFINKNKQARTLLR